MPPILTEKEINHILNVQPPSKPSWKEGISIHFPTNSIYHKSKIELVDKFKEEQTDKPICLIGDTTYFDEFPKFDQSDDDVL